MVIICLMESFSIILFFGVGASIFWGAADFSGGYATKMNNVFSVTFISQVFGTLLFLTLGFLSQESYPDNNSILLGLIAGIFGGTGVAIFYQALSEGRMGIVAPVSAVTTTLIPIIIGSFIDGRLQTVQYFSILLIIVSIWLVSIDDVEKTISIALLKLPILSGINFGLFFVFVKLASETTVYFPMVAARIASMTILFSFGIITNKKSMFKITNWYVIIIAGIADALGNTFFVFSARFGRLDIASALAGLYPITTVVLAIMILKEKIHKLQTMGILIAISGIILLNI